MQIPCSLRGWRQFRKTHVMCDLTWVPSHIAMQSMRSQMSWRFQGHSEPQSLTVLILLNSGQTAPSLPTCVINQLAAVAGHSVLSQVLSRALASPLAKTSSTLLKTRLSVQLQATDAEVVTPHGIGSKLQEWSPVETSQIWGLVTLAILTAWRLARTMFPHRTSTLHARAMRAQRDAKAHAQTPATAAATTATSSGQPQLTAFAARIRSCKSW